MSGQQLAHTLVVDKPGLKVIFTSGYSADLLGEHFEQEKRYGFFPSPTCPSISRRKSPAICTASRSWRSSRRRVHCQLGARAVSSRMRTAGMTDRVTRLNQNGEATGDFVLYWMQQSQRAVWNQALEYAVEQANELDLPLVVCFGLTSYPEANLRHYTFMLEGLEETAAALKKRNIQFVAPAWRSGGSRA